MEVCKEHTIFFSFSWKYFCFFCVFRIILWFFIFSSCAYFADGGFWPVLFRANIQMSLCERQRFHAGTSALLRLYTYYYIIVVFRLLRTGSSTGTSKMNSSEFIVVPFPRSQPHRGYSPDSSAKPRRFPHPSIPYRRAHGSSRQTVWWSPWDRKSVV